MRLRALVTVAIVIAAALTLTTPLAAAAQRLPLDPVGYQVIWQNVAVELAPSALSSDPVAVEMLALMPGSYSLSVELDVTGSYVRVLVAVSGDEVVFGVVHPHKAKPGLKCGGRLVEGDLAKYCYIEYEPPRGWSLLRLEVGETLRVLVNGEPAAEARVTGLGGATATGGYVAVQGSAACKGCTQPLPPASRLAPLRVAVPATIEIPFYYDGMLEWLVEAEPPAEARVEDTVDVGGGFMLVRIYFNAPPRTASAINPDAVDCIYKDIDGDGEPEAICTPSRDAAVREAPGSYKLAIKAIDPALGATLLDLNISLGQPLGASASDKKMLLAGLGLAAVVIIFALMRGGRR